MKSNWDLKLIAQFAGVAVLAGFITIALPYIGKERKVGAQKPQQKRYVISRPERCAEIVNGGVGQLTNSGSPVEYILCETPDGLITEHAYPLSSIRTPETVRTILQHE